ncbi:MAG TPA: FAD-dependent oxidoreductase [Solirubrobacterales bacterium]|nr:FAD-dependent oxidoreductase [Solirubrobacterales bacterium]
MSARVLIAGGGVAGLETALALREMAGDRVQIEICAPRRDFVYRPFAVGEPYGASHVMRYDLREIAASRGFAYTWSALQSVDGARRRATNTDHELRSYDYLVIAPGAKHLWSIPGATMFWGLADEFDSQGVVRALGTRELRHLVFAMPASHTWSLPLYELALLAAARQEGEAFMTKRTRLTIVTPEEAPLIVFGRGASEAVAGLLDSHDIEVVAGTHPVSFDRRRRVLAVAPGEGIEADGVIGLPRLEGHRFDGVPHDEHGFIPTDEHGGVPGLEGVYAAGDITTFPVKQGGIAAQQGDVVAAAIAAELGCEVDADPFEPTLRAVLWTGEGPRYLFGHPAGGHGEDSTLSERPPWPEQQGKIMSRYLTPFLEGLNRVPEART